MPRGKNKKPADQFAISNRHLKAYYSSDGWKIKAIRLKIISAPLKITITC